LKQRLREGAQVAGFAGIHLAVNHVIKFQSVLQKKIRGCFQRSNGEDKDIASKWREIFKDAKTHRINLV